MAVVHQFLSTVSSHFQRGSGAGSKDMRAHSRCQKLVEAFMEVAAKSGIEKKDSREDLKLFPTMAVLRERSVW